MPDPFKPHRVGGGYFKPHPETVWPEPNHDEPLPMASAYENLLTHPCGIEMLRSARRGWKAIQEEEAMSYRSGTRGGGGNDADDGPDEARANDRAARPRA